MTRQKLEKRAANRRNASRYPQQRRKDRKKARHERVIERETRWLAESGIPIDKNWPLA